MLKLNEDHLHALNIENFNVSTCKKYLWITSSGDQLDHSELTGINDTIILLNYSSAEVKWKRETFIVELDPLKNVHNKYSNALVLNNCLMTSNEDEKIGTKKNCQMHPW